jgi:hypothetical protein
VFDRLTVLVAPLAFSLFSFRPIPVLSILVPTSKSHHHFSPSHTLFPPSCTSIILFSPFSLTCPCLCPSTFLFTFSLYLFSPGRLLFFLLLLENFLQFLFSLISSKPFPVYLYLPVSYFHTFPLSLSSLANSLNFFCVPFLLLSNHHLYTSSNLLFPSTYSYLA